VIVRILTEGQYDVADAALERLNQLDAEVEAAVAAGDEVAFKACLSALLEGVRTVGTPHPEDDVVESDLILPPADAALEEVRGMLAEDGLIPG
jgi:hypothetical protein